MTGVYEQIRAKQQQVDVIDDQIIQKRNELYKMINKDSGKIREEIEQLLIQRKELTTEILLLKRTEFLPIRHT